MDELHVWSKATYGKVAREIEQARCQMEQLMSMNAGSDDIRKVSDCMDYFTWRNICGCKGHVLTGFEEGDCNKKLFHQKVVWRA